MSEKILRGVAASAGVAIGPAFVYREERPESAARAAATPDEERARFQAALRQAEADLKALAERADQQGREILTAHQLMLQDPDLHNLVEEAILAGAIAEEAVQKAADQFAAALEALDDAYLRERAADVRDVGRRLVAALAGRKLGIVLERPSIVVARDLAPTDTISIERSLLLGIVTEQGGPTSHTTILARSWGIPAVVAAPGVLEAAADGMIVALDGDRGEVVLDPGEETRARYAAAMARAREQAERDRAEASLPAVTPDGVRVELAANAGSPGEVAFAMEKGAEGIGLLRSEFLFMGRSSAPSEEEQYQAYAEALRNAGGRRVIIRTLDIGGDKDVPYLGLVKEENPFLGVRALRLCFRRPELFQTQLRALLRASVHGRLAIMFPMVGGLADLRRAKEALAEARRSLEAEGHRVADDYEVGIMVEIPSAALLADHLAREVDFFSIGTNDLVQYTLAVDRGNPELSALYQPYHPAVLRLIDRTVQAAHAAGKWVGVCGEMGGLPEGALLLLGLGVDELSMAPALLPRIRRLVRATPAAEARALAQKCLELGTPEEVLELVEPVVRRGLEA
ncbi:MAG: phosphoenolpyruvate--protein phosphotransferase [Bacillota bacterium]|nr:MAG: phosphoenolpyruvate--protein phosphotransferase [Bacillota bacterium]